MLFKLQMCFKCTHRPYCNYKELLRHFVLILADFILLGGIFDKINAFFGSSRHFSPISKTNLIDMLTYNM